MELRTSELSTPVHRARRGTGYGLLTAAIDFNSHKAIGLDGALRDLSDSPDGTVLLGIVATGLIGFALYSIADARYRNI